LEIYSNVKFMEIHAVRNEVFHADGRKEGRTDGQTDGYDKSNSRLSIIEKIGVKLVTYQNYTKMYCPKNIKRVEIFLLRLRIIDDFVTKLFL
jgi:hypothetical protein